ncbi:hypothetical protein LX32DRAFT_697239 [Colletotrichum zoysiae]|uniref:C2H2-type domain-containing protein n=1 Tax=Colletotrichum zoysiae TaxID=1216348 RepID=A0AAD9H8Q1_9PEZI|nr:hypothetical protein LX32DRAFT_697239 [Colletotrichum zoysiae]
MSRKGKERERDYRHAFRPGAGDPALWCREEDEGADWTHGPDGRRWAWTDEPDPTPGEWTAPPQQATGESPHADPQPGAADWDPGDYMHMDARSPLPDQQDESASSSSFSSSSSSSSSPFDAREPEEPAPVVAEPSRASTKNKHKPGSSAAKASARGAPPKQPVQCDWEGCGKWFPRPTELNKHVKKHHLPPSIACEARDAAPLPCDKMFRANKDMYRHVRNAHPLFAADPGNNIPPEGGRCPVCGGWVGRDDNLKRHVDEQHKDARRERRRRGG